MKQTVVIFESTQLDVNDYDAIMKELEAQNNLYLEKRISHVAFERDGSWSVVDVWESPEAFAEFAQNTLMPIMSKLGINAPEPTVLPAHRFVGQQAEIITA